MHNSWSYEPSDTFKASMVYELHNVLGHLMSNMLNIQAYNLTSGNIIKPEIYSNIHIILLMNQNFTTPFQIVPMA